MKIFTAAMTFSKLLLVFFILNSSENGVNGGVLSKRETDQNIKNVTKHNGSFFEKNLLGDFEEKNLEQEILKELNHLSFRKQREILVDLEKQQAKFNVTPKSLVSSESEILSPLNVEELKSIRKTIKASNSSLPAIRNKRTLNLLLNLVARAMGYTLTPSNPDAEWIPRQQPQPSAQPCSPPPSPCMPSPPSTPPPCSTPSTPPPPPCSGALMQHATIPPNQINPNTISYPYRPARTIPLFNFAPLPAGIRVPYPPLLQPPAQQRTPCPPQQTSPPSCNTPANSPPPCTTTPAPPMPQPCKPTPSPSPLPCGTTPPPPPCGTTPTPQPPPCSSTSAPQPPPCNSTPAPKQQPCAPTPPSPCGTPAPLPPCTNSTPTPSPCAPPPNPPPCSPPAASPSNPPKKNSIVLEYDDPIRIEIFSNDKKYLPASGKVYSGDYDDQQQDWHSHFFPSNEKSKNKENDYEEEEMQEEHVEEEEEDETPGQLRNYEDEDERNSANREDEEDESETNLSVVKKPIDQEIRKIQRRKSVSSKAKSMTTYAGKRNESEDKRKNENKEKAQKMIKPKRKKWVRIVKKQRRKTKMDSNPVDNFQVYTSDSVPEGTRISPNIYKEKMSGRGSHSYDASDVSNYSGSQSAEDFQDFRKVIINNKQIHSPNLEKAYEFNINPYTHALEPEEARRAKLEKAVEKYVEDYVEKQLGQELIKNTGIPKTTVFEFAPENGPKIQTITTTIAKTSHSGPVSAKVPARASTTARPYYRNPNGNTHIVKQRNYEETSKKRGNTYEALTRKF